jgi:hypothetical protein
MKTGLDHMIALYYALYRAISSEVYGRHAESPLYPVRLLPHDAKFIRSSGTLMTRGAQLKMARSILPDFVPSTARPWLTAFENWAERVMTDLTSFSVPPATSYRGHDPWLVRSMVDSWSNFVEMERYMGVIPEALVLPGYVVDARSTRDLRILSDHSFSPEEFQDAEQEIYVDAAPEGVVSLRERLRLDPTASDEVVATLSSSRVLLRGPFKRQLRWVDSVIDLGLPISLKTSQVAIDSATGAVRATIGSKGSGDVAVSSPVTTYVAPVLPHGFSFPFSGLSLVLTHSTRDFSYTWPVFRTTQDLLAGTVIDDGLVAHSLFRNDVARWPAVALSSPFSTFAITSRSSHAGPDKTY